MSTTTPMGRLPSAPADAASTAPVGLGRVLVAGLAVEAALLLGLTWPLRIWRPPDAITESEPLSAMFGQSAAGLVRFVLTLAVWCACYLWICRSSRRPLTAQARRAMLTLPILFALTLAPTWPAASKDLYHYILEGRTLVVHGENPLTTPPAALPADSLGWIISSWEWEPSRYGPLWALIAAAPAALAGDSLRAAVLGFKAIGILSFFATAALVWATVRRVRPGTAMPAFVLVAWNPLLLFESAANAHNDLPMLALTALALYLAARRDWTAAFPALAGAVLIKYVTGLLGPLLLLWAWRASRDRPEERRRIVAGLALAAGLVIACYAIFWSGPDTLGALTGAAGDALNSPGWLLREALARAGLSDAAARLVVSLPLALVFATVYALLVRSAWSSGPRFTAFARLGFIALTAYLWTLSWWFWPWYVTWVLPLAALWSSRRAVIVAQVWSIAALAAYVPITFRPLFWGEPPDGRMPFAVTLTVFLPTALAAVVLLRRGRCRQGKANGSVDGPASEP